MHICYSKELFSSLVHVLRFTITLPNQNRITLDCIGDLRLFSTLLLENMLFIPTFRFNLILASALTTYLPILILFVGDSCLH